MTTEDARKLFVAGLPESMTEEVLRQLFEATGSQVVEVSLPRDRATGRPRGFGFVTLQSGDHAERARSALDGSVQAGRSISVRAFQGAGAARREGNPDALPTSPVEDRTLYVGNLPYDATSDEVEQVLIRAGVAPVLRVHLPVGPDGRPRGFGFVTLSTPEAVQLAIPAMQNADLRGRRVMVKVAHPRGAAPSPVLRPQMGPGGVPASAARPSALRSDAEPYSPRDDSVPPPRAHRPPQSSSEFDEEEGGVDGAARASGKAKATAVGRGSTKANKAAATKRKGERVVDDRRSRGGGASWQRWEDWDDD